MGRDVNIASTTLVTLGGGGGGREVPAKSRLVSSGVLDAGRLRTSHASLGKDVGPREVGQYTSIRKVRMIGGGYVGLGHD